MNIRKIATMKGNQDGAIWGDLAFRFDTGGHCCVYDLTGICEGDGVTELSPIGEFTLDRKDVIVPHSNAVVFGNEFYEEDDEFPLLYSNVYNNYQKAENKRVGVLCVYRIKRSGDEFSSELVQTIEVGFTDDRTLWRSAGETADVRPYGNFVIDREKSLLFAFVMRDADKTTRYFSFDLPKGRDGEYDATTGVKKVTLMPCDIKYKFDTPYHEYMQGACLDGRLIYSVEGFTKRKPALRIIDPERHCQTFFFDFLQHGYEAEPEFIDFYNGRCIYSDAVGNVYTLDFD